MGYAFCAFVNKKKNVYFDRMFLVRRPTIKAYNEAASMQVT